MTRRVLVTGFDPFGGEEINASAETVKRLKTAPPANLDLSVRILPTEFVRAPLVLEKAIQLLEPELVICLGQARGRHCITPERIAINVSDARRMADNAGDRPTDVPVVEDGPTAYRSTLPVRAIEERLRTNGIPAQVSNTAGTFVCNHVFYSLMHLISTSRPEIMGGFIHVPVLPEQVSEEPAPSMSLDDITRGVRLAISTASGA